MNVSYIVHLLQFLTCIALNKYFIGVLSQVLNISDDSSGICQSVTKEKKFGILVKTFVARRGDNIRMVMDSGSTIWDGNNSVKRMHVLKTYGIGNMVKLASLKRHSRNVSRTLYYQKRGYEWFEVLYHDFEILVARLLVERTLDLTENIDPSFFFTQIHQIYGLPATVVLPKGKIVITHVMDNFHVIWRKRHAHLCTSVIIHGHPRIPQLVHLHIKEEETQEELFYVKHGVSWTRVTKGYFYLKLQQLDNEEIQRNSQSTHQES